MKTALEKFGYERFIYLIFPIVIDAHAQTEVSSWI